MCSHICTIIVVWCLSLTHFLLFFIQARRVKSLGLLSLLSPTPQSNHGRGRRQKRPFFLFLEKGGPLPGLSRLSCLSRCRAVEKNHERQRKKGRLLWRRRRRRRCGQIGQDSRGQKRKGKEDSFAPVFLLRTCSQDSLFLLPKAAKEREKNTQCPLPPPLSVIGERRKEDHRRVSEGAINGAFKKTIKTQSSGPERNEEK